MLQKNFIRRQQDVNQPRIEWLSHLIHSNKIDKNLLSVLIGNDKCSQPFKASIFNIKIKGNVNETINEKEETELYDNGQETFAKNMEGCQLTEGGEILQVTPEYSGCRTDKGTFNKAQFMQNACLSEVKIIELDLSKAAKTRHDVSSTSRIGNITRMTTSTTLSTLGYREFIEAEGMLHFIDTLREFSNGKPVGIKLHIDKKEFHEICYSIRKTGLIPDFIVVEDCNGGDCFSQTISPRNSRMPLYESLLFVSKTLQTYGLEKQIKIVAYANILSAFDVLKILALGANVVYSEMPGYTIRNHHHGNIKLANRFSDAVNFHNNIMNDIVRMIEACGFKSIGDLTLSNFFRKLDELNLTALKVPNSSIVNSDWQYVTEHIKD
jgi:hypothetical protein